MRRKLVVGSVITVFIGIFLFFSFNEIVPQEIENAPDWMPLDTALAEAQNDQRLILIDIYERGCKFCREMEREVYPSETIRALLDSNFHPVKVNGNSDEMMTFKGELLTEQEFARQMGVTAYPFTVVLDSEGNIIERRRGFMGTQDLSRFLNNALAAVQSD